jgi:RNA polymerase sigma factor (sigma-70 family)
MTHWERAFTELVRVRGTALTRYAYLLCADPTEAADLVQEGLVRAFVRVRRGKDVDSLEAYVRRAMLTAYLDRRRRRVRWYSVRHLFVGDSSEVSAEESVVAFDGVRAALAVLSPTQRACVVLRFYDDLPVAEIAERLGCRAGTVKRHLSDAMERMARHVEIEEEGRVP